MKRAYVVSGIVLLAVAIGIGAFVLIRGSLGGSETDEGDPELANGRTEYNVIYDRSIEAIADGRADELDDIQADFFKEYTLSDEDLITYYLDIAYYVAGDDGMDALAVEYAHRAYDVKNTITTAYAVYEMETEFGDKEVADEYYQKYTSLAEELDDEEVIAE